jgi:hypothetical protein
VRPAVGFGDAEIGEQERRGRSHGTATVGMQGQLAGGMLGRGICPAQHGRADQQGSTKLTRPIFDASNDR